MSDTQTQQRGFIEASVQKLPSLACIGYVDEVGEGKVSESETYIVQPIHIQGVGASKSMTDRILYRPEWLVPGFDPAALEQEGDEGKSKLSVYRRNIAAEKQISKLKGLAGNDENFSNLAAALLNLEEISVASVQEALKSFFQDQDGFEFGYILNQRRDKTDETDGNGKAIYTLGTGYEVASYFVVNEDNLKRLRTRAKKDKTGGFRIAFEGDGE